VAAFRTKQIVTSRQEVLSPVADARPSLENALSAREREILLLVAHGDSNKLIARQLDIAETTVKVHVQAILRKLQLTSRVQAAVYAAAQGLV
jgi:two-component system, NarL family, nitrate/nitrite response regulator NarL